MSKSCGGKKEDGGLEEIRQRREGLAIKTREHSSPGKENRGASENKGVGPQVVSFMRVIPSRGNDDKRLDTRETE